MSAPLGSGRTPTCRTITEGVAVHWWPTAATTGDPCYCGTKHLKPDPATLDRDDTNSATDQE